MHRRLKQWIEQVGNKVIQCSLDHKEHIFNRLLPVNKVRITIRSYSIWARAQTLNEQFGNSKPTTTTTELVAARYIASRADIQYSGLDHQQFFSSTLG